jgi:uncharacterized protein YdhG (YjbR/CyaY superfamily)
MNKAKSGDRSARAINRATPRDVDEYIAGVPEPAHGILNKLRAVIRSAAPPGAGETISYKIPAFKHKGRLVWFAAFSNHCSVFPTASVVAKFKDELKGFATSKGTIRFPTDKPLPTSLIKRLVKARFEKSDFK